MLEHWWKYVVGHMLGYIGNSSGRCYLLVAAALENSSSIALVPLIHFSSRVVRNAKSKGWLPIDFCIPREPRNGFVQFRWGLTLLPAQCPSGSTAEQRYRMWFSVRNQFNGSGETKGETWLKWLSVRLPDCHPWDGCQGFLGANTEPQVGCGVSISRHV